MVQILFFSVFAILSGASSYRKIHIFIDSHYELLNNYFCLNWKKIPAYTTVRNIIKDVSSFSLEDAFRKPISELAEDTGKLSFIAFDGKVLRDSFDNFNDQKAVQCLSAFLTDSRIITAHMEIAVKTNELSYYVSTTVLNAGEFCRGTRGHLGIENSNHYVRDVSMNEDHSRIRNNSHIFSKLRSFALNIMRANKVLNIAQELFRNCMNIANLYTYKSFMKN